MQIPSIPNIIKYFCAVFVLLGAWIPTLVASQESTLILARAPQLSAATITETWAPFIDRIVQKTGLRIQLKVYSQRSEFDTDLFSGVPDFAYLNAYHAVIAKSKLGYIPMIHSNANKLQGIIVVRRDSSIHTIAELNGKTLAFPDPNAFGASLFPRALLTEREHIMFNAEYMGNHENVYRAVYLGRYAAGGGILTTLNHQPASLREHLRILYQTPDVPSHPLIVHPRVSSTVRDAVSREILQMATDPEGQKLLKAIDLLDPAPVNYDRDYKEMESLHLGKYMVPPNSYE